MFRRKRLISLLLILLLAISLISGCSKKDEVAKETELTVTSAVADIGDIAKEVKLTGVVKGKDEVHLMAKLPARVTSILVKPGQAVSPGQTILTLDSSDADGSVENARVALRLAENQVKNAATNLGKSEKLQEVGVENAEIALHLAELQLETASANLERSEKLHEAGAISTQQLEGAKSAYDSAVAGVEQAFSALSGQKPKDANAKSAYDSALAGVEQASIALQMVQTQMENYLVTSPISGVVGNIDVSVGDTANPSAPVAVVSNTSQLEIEVLASESEVNYINSGDEVGVVIKAVSGASYTGIVESVATVPDLVKRNYVVKISLPNDEGLIRSGMFAQVTLETEGKAGALCVPASALVPKGSENVVFTVDEEQRARLRKVKTGVENSKYVEIVEGIKKGEKVITKGNTLVSDGTLVRVVAGGDK
ncbi:MAG TPA: efflux RND transporter periplasmic adaptor subunit [Syntrophomonadaceae bacterium]|nr:efflux RND transporter periplasmic adaptor subunit [Syntrophomonadaceae bacterium]